MATLKDVLKVVSRIEDELARVRCEMATKIDLAKLEAKMDAHRAETAKGFANLERELEGHADPVHADLEADIVAIHKGLVRANVRGIPKELPSQVRAKGERPSKPAKKRKAR
jgi:ferritin-like metal-binding protein YciE